MLVGSSWLRGQDLNLAAHPNKITFHRLRPSITRPEVRATATPNLRPHPSTQIDLYPANSPSSPISGFRTAGGLIGRAHRDLRAKTGCRNGTVGACLRQIQSLPHLDDLDGFATRL